MSVNSRLNSNFIFQIILFIKFILRNSIYFRVPSIFEIFVLYSKKAKSLATVLLIFCTVLFLIKDYSLIRILYSVYWVIGIFIFLFNKQNIFLKFLGSSLVAHCVGTVCFEYFINQDVNIYYFLIKIVWAERLLRAFGNYIIFRISEFILMLSGNYEHKSFSNNYGWQQKMGYKK